MKINSLLFTVWMLFLTIPMVAQQPDARDILDRAADAFRREGGVKITFSVRAPEGNTNGSIRLKGDKFLLADNPVPVRERCERSTYPSGMSAVIIRM